MQGGFGGALNGAVALALLGVCLFLFFHRLADRDLWSSHEARAGMGAQSVLDGPGALPRLFDGRPELQKPPLYDWLVAAVARARGVAVDGWAVRLPAALAALLCVATLLGLGWSSGRPLASLLAGSVLATAMHFTWLARIGRIDLPLALAVTVAVAAAYRALASDRAPLLLLACAAVALGVLLKGPIGLALPAAVVAAHLLLAGRWPACWELTAWRRLLADLGAWWGVPLLLALTLPVFLWAQSASDGRFFHEFFWAHNVERGLGGGRLRTHPWWLYGPYFLLYFLPWSALLPLALCLGRGRWWRSDPLARFGLAWLIGVLLLLSCARFKRADYLAPAYPGAALFLGCVLERWALALSWRGRARLLAAVVAVVVGMALVWVERLERRLPAQEPYRDYRAFAAEVRRRAPAPAPVLFFRTEAHALAFHVGRPLAVLVNWRDLRARLQRPGPHWVVMPPRCLDDWPKELPDVALEEVARNTEAAGGAHERPLVLLRGEAVAAKLQAGTTEAAMREIPSLDRFVGCLLGQAVGDGLGAPYEGLPPDNIYWAYGSPADLVKNPSGETLCYTDDTEMMIGVAEALAEHGRALEGPLCQAFVANYHPERCYGPGARLVLEAMADGGDWRGLAQSHFPGGSFGNGAAMRAAPVGLLFCDDLDRVMEESRLSALPTHVHPLGIEGAQLLAVAVALAVREPALDRKALYRELLGRAQSEEFRWHLSVASRLRPGDSLSGLGSSLEAHRSVVTAIACFAGSPRRYEGTLARAIALGNDTDTLAAMAGALSGAHLGAGAIPAPLLEKLEDGDKGRSHLVRLAARLHERFQERQ